MTPVPAPELGAAVARGTAVDAVHALTHAAAWVDAVLREVLADGADPAEPDLEPLQLVIALDDALGALTALGEHARLLAERAVVGRDLATVLTQEARTLAADTRRLTAVRLDADAERRLKDERAALAHKIATLRELAELTDEIDELRAVHEDLVRRVGDGEGALSDKAREALRLAAEVAARAGDPTARNGTGA